MYDCRTWQRLHSISTPCNGTKHYKDLHAHRLFVNEAEIKLSCANCNTIYILDTDGNLKQTHGPEIPIAVSSNSLSEGEHSYLNRPLLCQEDYEGAVMVADFLNDRLFVLTAEGTWRNVRLNGTLDAPHDALWWQGRLYVGTFCDKKLTMFQ